MSRFKQDDAPRIFEIEQKLSNIQQAVSWEKLQKTSCVTKFLMGLNESYDATRHHILMLKLIPSIEEVFNMVAQNERQKMIRPSLKTNSVIFQTSISHVVPGDTQSCSDPADSHCAAVVAYRPKQRPVCTQCGMTGHIVQKCYKLHGYPPGHKLYNTNGTSQQRSSG
ncbi:hypothetical protein N665_0768s0002 [Sinapis alba]|nr:hypothetical protein N665_0768s0002 [Sinapis alba]